MDGIRRAKPLALTMGLVIGCALTSPAPVVASELGEPPPYRIRPFDLADLPFDRLPWTNDPPPSLPAQPPVDRNGIRLYRREDGRLHYRPGSIAISGMKRIDAFRDTGDRAQLEQALVHARHLRATMVERDDAWWVPFWFDYPPENLKAPWFNAMSQGLVLSFFVRLHRVTGDAVHLQAAGKVFDSFTRLGQIRPGDVRPDPVRPWVSYVDERDYLWLEHYPVARPDHTLNVHLHALIGIYEYWQASRSPEARQILEGALTTMRDRAGRYRREGRVSVYGLRSRTNHLSYHEVHVWQLRLLGRMTGDEFFTRLGDTMAADRPPRPVVQGQPSETREGAILSRAPRRLQVAHYPPVRPFLRLAG
jgi:hypothetical protein